MKKALFLLAFLLLSVGVIAQSVTFGLRAGLSSAQQQYTNPLHVTYTQNAKTTFYGGGFADFAFGHFSIQPGVFLNGEGGETKTTEVTNNPPNDDVVSKQNIHESLLYLQIPLDLVYHIPFRLGKFYIGAGPFVAFGLSGKTTQSGESFNELNPGDITPYNASYTTHFGNTNTDYQIAYWGANAIGGIQLKNGMLISMGYNIGLTFINRSDQGFGQIKDRQLSLSVGYCFK